MDQRISFITLAVADLERTHRFYVDGLGWAPELFVPDEVLMIKEYRPGGISARARAVLARSARSTRLYHAEALEHDALSAKERFRHRANHVRFSLHAGLSARSPATGALAYAATYPVGFALYARDRIRS